MFWFLKWYITKQRFDTKSNIRLLPQDYSFRDQIKNTFKEKADTNTITLID